MSMVDLAVCRTPCIHHSIPFLYQSRKAHAICHVLRMKKLRFRNTNYQLVDYKFLIENHVWEISRLYSLKDKSWNACGFET